MVKFKSHEARIVDTARETIFAQDLSTPEGLAEAKAILESAAQALEVIGSSIVRKPECQLCGGGGVQYVPEGPALLVDCPRCRPREDVKPEPDYADAC